MQDYKAKSSAYKPGADKSTCKKNISMYPPLDLLEIHLWISGSVSMVASRSQWNIGSLSGIPTNMPRNL